MPLDSTFGEMIARDGGKLGIFFRAQTDPVIRCWAGFGDCEGGITAYDPLGAVYNGMGELKQVPDLEAVINGKASRVVFTLDGLSPQALQMADDDDDTFMRKLVSLGIASFDDEWQNNSPIYWLWWGFGDTVMIDTASSQGDDGTITGSVGLSVGSIFTSRRRPSYSHLTNSEQIARYPGDIICERTALYTQGVNKSWPHY